MNSSRFPARITRAAPTLHLAAFGKHRVGRHLDDFGLKPRGLAPQATDLSRGLARQIDSAAWEELSPTKKLAHSIICLVDWPHQFHRGSIWSSQDGKGRAKFPWCFAHVIGAPPAGRTRTSFPSSTIKAAAKRRLQPVT